MTGSRCGGSWSIWRGPFNLLSGNSFLDFRQRWASSFECITDVWGADLNASNNPERQKLSLVSNMVLPVEPEEHFGTGMSWMTIAIGRRSNGT